MKASGGVEECEGENESNFFCRNCEYIVIKFIYILHIYFTNLRLFFYCLPHYQNTLSPLSETLYAGCISWFLKHWDSMHAVFSPCLVQIGVLRMHLSDDQEGVC